MIVELISFGLLALHEQTYRQFRALENKSAEDDWNSREITNLMSKINPSLTFIPIDPDFQLMPDGSKHHQDRPRKETCRLDNLNKLYARCGRILHVPNHLKKSTTVETFHAGIPSIVKKLRLSLQDHVVLTNHDSEQEATGSSRPFAVIQSIRAKRSLENSNAIPTCPAPSKDWTGQTAS